MGGWPVAVASDASVACGAVLWRLRGTLCVTVIAKTTFRLRHDDVAELTAPLPLVLHDTPHDPAAPGSSLRAGCELAPYLPQADLTLVGRAYAPGGRPTPIAAVRLAIFRDDRALVDRTLRIFGDRAPGAASPQPFVHLPLVYERALGGPQEPRNPVGVGSRGEARPNLVDATDGQRPACFAPLSSSWPCRAAVLTRAGAMRRNGPILELADDFPWAYFQAAPPEQRCEHLRGDEWIVLEGVHPSLARVQCRLPGARVRAHLTGNGSDEPVALALAADTLAIDAEAMRCDLVWRGYHLLPASAVLADLAITATLVSPAPEAAARDERPPPVDARRASFGQTAPATPAPAGPAVPFRPGAAPIPRVAAPAPPGDTRASFGATAGMTSGEHWNAAERSALPYQPRHAPAAPAPAASLWQETEAARDPAGSPAASVQPASAPPPPPPPPAPPIRVAPPPSSPSASPAPTAAPPGAEVAVFQVPPARSDEPPLPAATDEASTARARTTSRPRPRPRNADDVARHVASSGAPAELVAALLSALKPPPPAPEAED